MLTQGQEKWINHLSDVDKIKIVPFNPMSQEEFEKIKSLIQSKIGPTVRVEHRGASYLGISGHNEIDIYVPVSESLFDNFIVQLSELFGEPHRVYPLERARFNAPDNGIRIDIHLVNKEHASWLNSEKFENYLKTHPETLEECRLLKEAGDGLSIREYYRGKIEFINNILAKV
ncbi:MAG: GrpB family protein [bacterium]|nr:GrpB family protein [bacterium]